MSDPIPRRTIRLNAPAGARETGFGTERFPIDDAGEVEVPAEAVEALVTVGGFSIPEVAPEPNPDVALLVMPDELSFSVSFDGVSYASDEHGVVSVPVAAVAELLNHGLVPHAPVEAAPAPAAPSAKATFAPK